MIRMKVGGMILTGLAAFLVADKVVSSMNRAVINMTEASKWKGYYKCWSRGNASGEPVAPGYSRTTRPDGANYEIVDDPSGQDHANDNQPEPPKTHDSSDTVKAVCEAIKAISEKAIDTLTKRDKAVEGAKECEEEAVTNDISDKPGEGSDTDGDDGLEHVINGTFDIPEGESSEEEFEESVETAREAGVPEEDILHSTEEIDELFTK